MEDIFIFPKEDMKIKQQLVVKIADTAETSLNFEKKIQIINLKEILGKVTKFYEIWMSY